MISVLKCYACAALGATAFLTFDNHLYMFLHALGTVIFIILLCLKDIKKDLVL